MEKRITLRLFSYFLPLLFLLIACTSEERTDNLSVKKSTYLDYAASWQINEESLAEFIKVSRIYGNSSGINPHAEQLKQQERQATNVIAKKIGAKRDQIHYVSCASVANNIAVLGVAYKNPGCHLITSKIEHKSILNVFKHLEKNGYKVTYLNVDRYGYVDLKQLKNSIRKNTKLISIQMFNSEIGTLQNMQEIGKIAHEHGVLFHSDAAQSFCKYDIDVNKMGIDLLTISGYKIGAPKGIAALYVRDINRLQPIMFGSGDALFPGTKSTALICAFGKAVEKFTFDKKRICENYVVLVNKLKKIGGVVVNSSEPSHIVSISIAGVLLKDILNRTRDFSFSAGCSCLGQDKSNVIEAIDPQGKLPGCTIRISFSDMIETEQLINFANELRNVIEQLRKEKAVREGCESMQSEVEQNRLKENLDDIQKLLSTEIYEKERKE